MIKPIPKRELPHQANYKAYLGNQGEEETYDTVSLLKCVKIEPRKQFIYDANGRQLVGNAIMFYDLKNSSGLTNAPIINSIIEFNGYNYRIVDVESLYASENVVHHYEVMLK